MSNINQRHNVLEEHVKSCNTDFKELKASVLETGGNVQNRMENFENDEEV